LPHIYKLQNVQNAVGKPQTQEEGENVLFGNQCECASTTIGPNSKLQITMVQGRIMKTWTIKAENGIKFKFIFQILRKGLLACSREG
jgi:hypothetical protein